MDPTTLWVVPPWWGLTFADNGLSAFDGYDVLADEGVRGLPLVTGGEVGSGEGAFVAPASGDGSEGELEVGGG